MKTKKLELKHLAAYLPYNVKMFANGFIGTLQTLNIDNTTQSGYKIRVSCSDWWENNNIDGKIYRPILRPLSDLIKEIEVNGVKVIPIDIIYEMWCERNLSAFSKAIILQKITLYTEDMPYWVIETLLSWHFNVFGLIDSGLAINYNDINK